MPNGFVHVELATDDVGAAKKFYRSLFDWKLVDNEMGPGMIYTMVDAGKGNVGGGMMKKAMPEQPTQWLAYVQVDSVKKTTAMARKLGANVIIEYQPIPGMGAFGIIIDPSGAPLGVYEAGKPAPKAAPAKKPAAKKPAAKKPAAKPRRPAARK